MKKILIFIVLMLPMYMCAQQVKISALPAASYFDSDDVILGNEDNVTKKWSKSVLLKDPLDSITDLRTALNGKLNKSDTADMLEPYVKTFDELRNPLTNASFNFATNTLTFNYTTASSSKNFFKLAQSGSVTVNSTLLRLHTGDPEVMALKITHSGVTPDTSLYVSGYAYINWINGVELHSGSVWIEDEKYVQWGSTANTSIQGDITSEEIDIITGGNPRFRVGSGANYSFRNLSPFGDRTYNLGSTSAEWNNIFVGGRIYVKNATSYIDTSSNELLFHDPTNGDQLLSDLIGGGGVTDSSFVAVDYTPTSSVTPVKGRLFWDSDDDLFKVYDGSEWYTLNPPRVDIDTVAYMLVDTARYNFGIGLNNTGDSASMIVGAWLGWDREYQDSIIPRIWEITAYGEAGDTARLALYHHATKVDGTSPTTIKSEFGVGVNSGTVTITSFDVSIFPPGYYWAELTALPGTGKRPKTIVAPFGFSKKRQE